MKMFYGQILEPGKKYTQTSDHSFHLTMAAIEPSSKTPAPNKPPITSVLVESNKQNFILCNLDQANHIQQPLDFVFLEGEEVTFFVNGDSKVHLTGYIMPESDIEDGDMFDESDSDVDSELGLPQNNVGKKRKEVEDDKKGKKVKWQIGNDAGDKAAKAKDKGKPNQNNKKSENAAKKTPGGESDDEDDDDDMSDDDMDDSDDMSDLLGQFDEDDLDSEDEESDENESSPEVKKTTKPPQKQLHPQQPQQQKQQKPQQQQQKQGKPQTPAKGQQNQQKQNQNQGKNKSPNTPGNKPQHAGQNSGGKGKFNNSNNKSPGNKKPGTPFNKNFGGGGGGGSGKKKPWVK